MAVSLPTNVAQPLLQASVATETLGLRPGQVVEALVVSSGQDGKAQLAIDKQLIEAALQVRLQAGTLVRLLVQGTGTNTRLTVQPPQGGLQGQAVPAQGSSGQGTSASPTPVRTPNAPAPTIQGNTGRAQPAPVPVQSARPSQTVAPLPSGITVPAAVQAGPAGTTAQTVVPTQNASVQPQIPVPAPQTSAPRPGVLIGSAHADSPQSASVAQQSSQSVAGQLAPGTVLQLRTQGIGANIRPVLVQISEPEVTNQPAQPNNQSAANASNPLQQAVVQTVQSSVFRQDSISALLTSLAGLGTKLSNLPKPVAQAGTELLAARLNVGTKPLDGAALKQALTRSGVLLENTLSKPSGPPVQPGDIKAALLKLGDTLRLWLGESAKPAAGAEQCPPPPTQGAAPRAERPTSLPLPPNLSNTEIGARLLGQADAALARMRLTQISSLPDASARGPHGASSPSPDLNMELPLLFGSELSIAQFQILRDGGNEGGREHDAAWKMRFSVNFSQTGEVGATVSLRRRKIGVMLWAEREDMAEMLEEMTPELADMLAARGLEPGSIRCRHGSPPPARRPVGAFMDNSS